MQKQFFGKSHEKPNTATIISAESVWAAAETRQFGEEGSHRREESQKENDLMKKKEREKRNYFSFITFLQVLLYHGSLTSLSPELISW